MQRLTRLFHSDNLTIEDYRCDGNPASRDEEEFSQEHQIVIPIAGTFVRHDSTGKFAVDVNHAAFFHKWRPFRVSHPAFGGDACIVFALAPRLRAEFMRWYGPSDDADEAAPFPVDWLPLAGRPHIGLRQTVDSLSDGSYASALDIEERALQLLGEVVRAAFGASRRSEHLSRRTNSSAREVAHQAKLVLAERLKEKVTLGDVASAVHCSPYYLSRVFGVEAKISLHRYLNRLRLRASLESISGNPKQSIADVALEHGFSSHSHFSAAFRLEFGISPSQLSPGSSRAHLRELSKIRIA